DPLQAEQADAGLVDELPVLPLDPALLLADDVDATAADVQPEYSGRGHAVENELRDAGLPAVELALDPVLSEGATLITPQTLEWSAEEAAFLAALDASTLALPGAGQTATTAQVADTAPVAHNDAGFQDSGSLVDADTL